MEQTRIILADDHPVYRVGLRALLEREPGFRVIGEAHDGLEAVRAVHRLNPDVLILDLTMPGMNGMQVTREVKLRSTRTQIIIVSMHSGEQDIAEAFRRGADGYVLKDTHAGEVVKAVREVMAGRRYYGDLLPPYDASLVPSRQGAKPIELYETLTLREREILYLAAQGRKNREIAVHLGISTRTAETHRLRVMHKLRLNSQADLLHYALRKKLVSLA
jgi:DNA-binding NarL/FixJ family response regulator